MWFGRQPGACTNVSALTSLGICECLSGHHQSSQMSRVCAPSKRGHVLKQSQLTGMWQGKGISSQHWPDLIGAALGEGNKRLQISRHQAQHNYSCKNSLSLWSRISTSCANFFFLIPTTPFYLQNSSSVAYVAFAVSQLESLKDLFLVCFSTLMKPRELTSLTFSNDPESVSFGRTLSEGRVKRSLPLTH